MNAQSLRRAVEKTGAGKVKSAQFNCCDIHADRLLEIIKQVFPNMKFSETPDTEPGVYKVLVRTEFQVGIQYFQSLAKIAFHHYLLHTHRSYGGGEPIFRDIRRFISRGGDIDAFFPKTGDTFGSPIGNDVEGGKLTLATWCHVILVDEREDVSRVCMWLFVGPDHLPNPIHVTLAIDPRRILCPAAIWGQVYEYEKDRSDKYAGRVKAVPTIRRQ
jgi:hypothetical protein